MNTRRVLSALLAISLSAGLVSACGSDDDESDASGASQVEAAFLKAMIPHHESAVEMAEMAQERGEHPAIKRLADAIVGAQTEEIAQMEEIYRRLTGEEIAPDPDAHEDLGLSVEEAGMHEESMVMLEKATKDFDMEFIDAMIPHHQGAIRMARVAVADTDDDEITQLANAIVTAQSREIADMNSWRTRWYGSASPAGGVPSENEELPPSGEDGGEHGSGH